jgi:excisionase family DNA binding protein
VNASIPNDLLMRFLQATPERRAASERVLSGEAVAKRSETTRPLLLGMSASAKLLGVSRATLWRMVKAGKLTKVEVLPGSFRLRRYDLEAIAAGKEAVQ